MSQVVSHPRLRDLIRLAEEQGWRIERMRGGHLKWIPPVGEFITSSSTPKMNGHAWRNVLSQLEKRGLITDAGEWRRKQRGERVYVAPEQPDLVPVDGEVRPCPHECGARFTDPDAYFGHLSLCPKRSSDDSESTYVDDELAGEQLDELESSEQEPSMSDEIISADQATTRWSKHPCPYCGREIAAQNMGRHIASRHPEAPVPAKRTPEQIVDAIMSAVFPDGRVPLDPNVMLVTASFLEAVRRFARELVEAEASDDG